MESDEGVLSGLSAGKIWAEMSTTDAAEVARLGTLSKPKAPARLIALYRAVVSVQRQVILLFSPDAAAQFSSGYCQF